MDMRSLLNVLGRLVVGSGRTELVDAVEVETSLFAVLLPPTWNRSGKGMGKWILEERTAAAMIVFGLA